MSINTTTKLMDTILKVKVQNMPSARLPMKRVPNQFIITTENGRYFQSYESVIAFIGSTGDDGHRTILDETYWDYSTTTGKYRNQFLGETKAETEAKIKSGEYTLANLN